jgi:hypothetical protein
MESPLWTIKDELLRFRGDSRMGLVGFGFGSDGSGQFDFLEKIG